MNLANSFISLTTSEFYLLWLSATYAENVLSRDFIYKNLRGIKYDGLDRSIDSMVAILRRKLGVNTCISTRIITVCDQGYPFVPDTWE